VVVMVFTHILLIYYSYTHIPRLLSSSFCFCLLLSASFNFFQLLSTSFNFSAPSTHHHKGDRRKVKVKQYIYSDPLHMTVTETTTHLAIYHEDSHGERTLYRHFLRSPDGTLLEVFGDLVADYQGEYLALEKALLNAADQVAESKKFK
jgi:hypothetical protein